MHYFLKQKNLPYHTHRQAHEKLFQQILQIFYVCVFLHILAKCLPARPKSTAISASQTLRSLNLQIENDLAESYMNISSHSHQILRFDV